MPANKLFSPDVAATQLMEVLGGLTPDDTGGLFTWDGSRISA
jgi:hypothetical protein